MQSGMEMMMSAAIKSIGLDPEEIKAKVEAIGKMAVDANDKFIAIEASQEKIQADLMRILLGLESIDLFLRSNTHAGNDNSNSVQ